MEAFLGSHVLVTASEVVTELGLQFHPFGMGQFGDLRQLEGVHNASRERRDGVEGDGMGPNEHALQLRERKRIIRIDLEIRVEPFEDVVGREQILDREFLAQERVSGNDPRKQKAFALSLVELAIVRQNHQVLIRLEWIHPVGWGDDSAEDRSEVHGLRVTLAEHRDVYRSENVALPESRAPAVRRLVHPVDYAPLKSSRTPSLLGGSAIRRLSKSTSDAVISAGADAH